MLPPPAPISTSSTVVIRTGRPLPGAKRLSLAASKEYETSGWPLSIIAIFAVVPPMSKAISRSSFCSLPIRAAESAPPAGPDSSKSTGRCFASEVFVRPPFESISIKGAWLPLFFRASSNSPI